MDSRTDERAQEYTQELIQEEILTLGDLLLRKNHDYGNSAFKAPSVAPYLAPATAILVRLSDKIERLQTLAQKVNHEVQETSETFEDTLRDLAGYCLLYLVEKRQATAESSTREENRSDAE